jgi:hypothetical protein
MILTPFCTLLYCNGDVDSAPPQRRAIAELRRLASRPYSRNELKSMALTTMLYGGNARRRAARSEQYSCGCEQLFPVINCD